MIREEVVRRNKIVKTEPPSKQQVSDYVDKVVKDNSFVKPIDLSSLTDREIKEIKQIKKLDTSGYKHELIPNELRHILKQHGDPVKEALNGQLPITKEDLKKIPEIISSWDKMEDGGKRNNRDSIIYVKRVNGTIYYVEVIGNRDNRLTPKTMWKKPSAGDSAINNSVSTSETAGVQASVQIIPPFPEKSSH